MSGNLIQLEKVLRKIAKHSKTIKYTKGLLFAFIMMGMSAFSAEVTIKDKEIEQTKTEINDTVKDLKDQFRIARAENDRLLKNANIDLIQLMEQGDQVIKSPWSSWQFGINYYLDDWDNSYKGYGDKKEKYPYEGIFVRSDDPFVRTAIVGKDDYNSLIAAGDPTSATTRYRELISSVDPVTGLPRMSYGLISTRVEYTEPVKIEVNESISPKTITKTAPTVTISPTTPTVTAPVTVSLGFISAPGGFIPTQIPVPVPPIAPAALNPEIPELTLDVDSNGNGTSNVIDGGGSNASIQMVAVTGGDFKVERKAGSKWEYSYSNYSGMNAWPIGAATTDNPAYSSVPAGGTWSGWSRGLTTRTYNRGFQSVIGARNAATMLNNSSVIYSSEIDDGLDIGEFAHLDVHGISLETTDIVGLNNAIATLPNKLDILNAWNISADLYDSTPGYVDSMNTWINSGNMIIEGGNLALTNTYTHTGGTGKQVAINTGVIRYQPFQRTSGSSIKSGYVAGFAISDDNSGPSIQNIMLNTGTMESYVPYTAMYVINPIGSKLVTALNKGTMKLYGKSSVGVYVLTPVDMHLDFENGVTYTPLKIYGDKSIGFYDLSENTANSVVGNIAVNIGAPGIGNVKFTTPSSSDTSGVIITDYNSNDSDENIGGSFGILSTSKMNLTKHEINIYDKTKGNVGVHPGGDISISLGNGTINMDGGNSNIGVFINEKGKVTSTGSINITGGTSNTAIFAKGGTVGPAESVTVDLVKATNTQDTVLIYASDGATVTLNNGLSMTGATVNTNASTVNKKDSGAVFATGVGTVVTLDRTSTPSTPNISITGVKLTDAIRYVGFGLFSESGAKINAKYNNIEIKNGSSGIVSIGSVSETDFTGGKLKVDGYGYAAYSDGAGKINLSSATLILEGHSSAFDIDMMTPPAASPITVDGSTQIVVNSDDVIVFRLKNANSLNTVNLKSTITSAVGGASSLISPHISAGGASTSNNYIVAAADGGVLTIGNLDKSGTSSDSPGTPKGDGYFYYNKFMGQRLKATTAPNVIISSVLTSAQALPFHSQVVGFEMNSSILATSNTEAQINIVSNSKVISDRTDAGVGATGLYINYGKATIDSTSTVDVESDITNTVNDKGVGIFAVNGSEVNNGGTVTVDGNSAFGLIGMTYRVDPVTSLPVVNEFGGKPGEGTIKLNNTGTIDLSSGTDNVGIYGLNNNNVIPPLASSNVTITNSGNINVGDGNTNASVGIYTNSGDVTNSGNITVGKKGAGIYTGSGNVTVTGGTISIGEESTALSMNMTPVGGTSYTYSGTGGTINVNGQKVTGYSLIGLDNMTTPSLFTDNLNVLVGSTPTNAGEKYTQYNLLNSKFIANKSMTFSKDGFTYINAKNSAVELSSGATVSSTGLNSIGIYLDGDTLTSPITPFTGTYALKNSGTIILGDSSTGVYGKNMSSAIGNAGTITVGNNSTAVYASDATLENISGGNINVGSNSTGMYQVTSSGKNTSNSGTITGLSGSNGSTGLVVENAGTSLIPTAYNTGIITINGTNGVGIYSKGSNDSNITNTGTITLANGISESNPNVGIYSDNQGLVQNDNIITSGNYGIGVYATNVDNNLSGNITVGDYSIGIFSSGTSGNVNHKGSITVGTGESVGIFAMGSNKVITTDSTSSMSIGNTSFGIVNLGSGNRVVSNMPTVNLSDDSVYIYSTDNTNPTSGLANITNNTQINATGSRNYGIYSAGKVENYSNIVMDTVGTVGNVGIYSTAGIAENYNTIKVGYSDPTTSSYGMGMAATGGSKIYNKSGGVIDVNGSNSIGMYGSGAGTEVYNQGTININANNAIGMYLDNGAKGINTGTIKSIGTTGAIGIVVKNGSIFENQSGGVILIDSSAGYAIFKDGGTWANYGSINIISGSVEYTPPAPTPSISPIRGGVQVDGDAGTITVNGVSQPITPVSSASGGSITTLPVFTGSLSVVSPLSIGMYVNTSGVQFTNPIGGISNLAGLTEAKLIYGAEAAKRTTSKYISISGTDPILKPYNDQIIANPSITWNHMSGSLTWEARAEVNRTTDGTIKNLYMAKLPYTMFSNDTNTYNFTDGLEQRYGVEALDTRENALFQKLNGIGNNEEILLYQAYDEMMGHQYANTQQRLYTTSGLLNKEFNYLANEWATASKQSNKVKVFGMKGEYNTDTAGIIDYKNDAYGMAYVHEDETLKLGANTGWYAGVVHNTFNFKDIGESKEETTIGKLGIFKTTTFDNNGSLKWKISGEGMLGYSEMNRKFLVVDEIFGARSTYTSYGLALRNELSKEIRLSERTSLKPYGSIDIEYGKYGNIKEKTGEVRLEVKGNDYYSVKPELGLEFKYKQPMFIRTNLTASIGIAYENELGKVNDVDNKARVAYTNADYFNLRSEKENKEGNLKGDLKLGIENSRVGFTLDLGYDTKGENVRGGVGLRVIY